MFIVKRFGAAIPTLIIVSLLVFFLVDLIPGDPARNLAGQSATVEEVAQLRASMGLDAPMFERYVRFVQGMFDPGAVSSLRTGRPVSTEFIERLPNTLAIAFGGLAFGLLVGTVTGIICALRQGRFVDFIVTVGTLAGISMPIYWIGLLAIWWLSVNLGLLPASGAKSWEYFVLPILVVSTRPAAMISRLVTSSLLDVMDKEYIDTARSKGLSEIRVVLDHGLRNALVAAVSIAGVQFGALLGGSVVTETVFGIPGIGRLLVDAVGQADYPVIQYSILMFAAFFILINLVVDVLSKSLDPRTRQLT
ncbi:ABC-type dipeptide/oligopeptide/nickel transport system permease component [Arthrobacter sp. V4I6]|uniref:ABC transporter permease n=1 Tax=unclassified Arthrobacter TaxID=235627 RepID=UPI002782F8C5|nr:MULTISPECIES: ABC transporter permease [unclassified Arthrobacter]MDQ0819485.1 ABC-type dipeptide/oligopeptide/nickel transport system permease component [Arthrobacter sp. V1I7]MDQ0853667.1 ABC-type dipeptide/oligopeptide/nickel transport system permease component [Arthrobacter sp. V4I6]